MSPDQITGEELLGRVRAMVDGGTLRETAAQLGVSPAFLHDILAGRKPPGRKLPRYFGLEPVTVYRYRAGTVRLRHKR